MYTFELTSKYLTSEEQDIFVDMTSVQDYTNAFKNHGHKIKVFNKKELMRELN